MGTYGRSKRTLDNAFCHETGPNIAQAQETAACRVVGAETLFEQKEVVVDDEISRFEIA